MRLALILLFVIPLTVGCGGGDEKESSEAEERQEGTEPGDCSDDADNDGDGLFDCDDDGCAGSDACSESDDEPPPNEDTGDDAGDDTGTDEENDGLSDDPASWSCHPITQEPCDVEAGEACDYTAAIGEDGTVISEDFVCHPPPNERLVGEECGPGLGWCEAGATCNEEGDGSTKCREWCFSSDDCPSPKACVLGTYHVDWLGTCDDGLPYDPTSFECDPITQAPCDVEAGEACDISYGETSFSCFPPPNDVPIGETCSEAIGFCVAGATCTDYDDSREGVCRQFCLYDDDCTAGGACEILDAYGWLGTCTLSADSATDPMTCPTTEYDLRTIVPMKDSAISSGHYSPVAY